MGIYDRVRETAERGILAEQATKEEQASYRSLYRELTGLDIDPFAPINRRPNGTIILNANNAMRSWIQNTGRKLESAQQAQYEYIQRYRMGAGRDRALKTFSTDETRKTLLGSNAQPSTVLG